MNTCTHHVHTQAADDAATAPSNVGGNERNVMAKYGAEQGAVEDTSAQEAAAAAADLDEDL